MENLQNAIRYFNFTSDALLNIEETDADVLGDLAKVRDGSLSLENLLLACLDGADDDRVQGWRDYVVEIARVSEQQPQANLCNLYVLADCDCVFVFAGLESECDAFRDHNPCVGTRQYQMQFGLDGAVENY